MRPRDIIVGQKYKNSFSGNDAVFMGFGRRKKFTNIHLNKGLLIIESQTQPEYLGVKAIPYNEESKEFWNCFYKI